MESKRQEVLVYWKDYFLPALSFNKKGGNAKIHQGCRP